MANKWPIFVLYLPVIKDLQTERPRSGDVSERHRRWALWKPKV